MSSFSESQQRQLSIATHRQDFKDWKQILEDLLTPTLHIKARARLSLFPLHSNNERLALMGIRNQTIVIPPPFRSAALHQNANPLPVNNILAFGQDI